jgi:alcohol dehydrogenase class IV
MMLGSLMAGMAFSNAALGAVHGLSHPLGAHLGLAHGFICGVLLPEVLELNQEAPFRDYSRRTTREKVTHLAAQLGFSSSETLISGLRELRAKVGLPHSLAGRGLTEELFPTIVAQCRSKSMSNNPRELSDEDLLQLLGRLASP